MSLLMNWLESLSHELTVADHCLRMVSPFSTCTECQESCGNDAISIDKNGVRILEKQCDGCGLCIPSCPVQALEGQSPNRKTINQTLILDEGMQPTKYELLYFYKRGIRSIAVMMEDEKMRNIIIETNKVLEKMDEEPFRIVKEPEPVREEQARLSRRDFFSKLSLDSKKLALSTVTPAKWRFDQGKFQRTEMFQGWALFQVDINPETCTLCEACFRLCPGQVFSVKDSLLTIDHAKCTGCSLCSDICREKAVQVMPEVNQSITFKTAILQHNCRKCSCDFLSWDEADICPICEAASQHILF